MSGLIHFEGPTAREVLNYEFQLDAYIIQEVPRIGVVNNVDTLLLKGGRHDHKSKDMQIKI